MSRAAVLESGKPKKSWSLGHSNFMSQFLPLGKFSFGMGDRFAHQFVSALRHDQNNPAYNPSFRQLLHISFKIAARKGTAISMR
jgi:hypothetical protein